MIKRSIYGLIRIFNALPRAVVDAKPTKLFKNMLQNRAKLEARNGIDGWERMYHVDCQLMTTLRIVMSLRRTRKRSDLFKWKREIYTCCFFCEITAMEL
jgi:hypothetical protein